MAKILDFEKARRIQSGHVCWNCKYYIRQGELMVDGPVSSICIIDREKNVYVNTTDLTPGDSRRNPDETCNRFEIDMPP